MTSKISPIYGFAICALIAVVLWNLAGQFDVDKHAWHIFSIFIAVIFAFILRPFPMGMVVLIGLVVLVVSESIPLNLALDGFADTTVWLVVSAFLIAGAVVETGLGRRISFWLVVKLGKTIHGLGYALCGSELFLAPFVPSNTARGGGILSPIVNSLSHSLGSNAEENPAKAGQYLTLTGAHANLITAAMFLTAMAANPLLAKAVNELYDVEFGWGLWALGSIVPGIVGLALLPLLIYRLAKPSVTDGKAAQKIAKEELQKMGPMSPHEKWMLFVMLFMVALWTTKFLHGIDTTTVAISGIIILLLAGAQSWENIIRNERAWDTLVWLGGLLTMANLLLDYGLIEWLVKRLEYATSGISGNSLIIILGVIYFYSMYAFSMLTAHIVAMALPFLTLCYASSTNPFLAAAIFAYFSCLCGCMTNYSTGPIIIYFGLGYVEAPKWFKVGFIISLYHLAIWLTVGLAWWRILGWW